LSAPTIHSFANLRQQAQKVGPKRVAVAAADDLVALAAARDAMNLSLASPVLIGDAAKIRDAAARSGLGDFVRDVKVVASGDPARTAVELVRQGQADIILKGHLRTDELLRAVLDKDVGLRTGRVLSDVLLYEDTLSGSTRLVGITDGGLNIAPSLEQKKQIVENAIDVLRCLGIARPKIAVMSATEAVSSGLASTTDAAALTEMAQRGLFGDADVYGPLALDNALLVSAAESKGIRNPVAGRADCMVVPSIEAGNLLGKAVKYLGGSACAHVVAGAAAPILIPSRVESAEDKVNAIALGVLYGNR
jgi:phosphate butyryltransferase